MPLWKIAFRSIQFRLLSSVLTAFSMSLGVALIVIVLVIHGVLSDSFNKGAQGYDLIIAGKGSPLDVVLSTVFYIKPPASTVPGTYLKMFQSGQYAHLTEAAIPVCIGHYFRGASIVGTSREFFTELKFLGNQSYSFAEGGNFSLDNQLAPFTAVVGSQASKKAGLKIGDTFQAAEVKGQDPDADHKPFKVVGILNPTGTPNDNVIFVDIDGFYDMHDIPEDQDTPEQNTPEQNTREQDTHEHSTHEHSTQRNLSAILLMTKQDTPRPEGMAVDPNSPDFNPAAVLAEHAYVNIDAMKLPQLLDETVDIQAVQPVKEITVLLGSIVGNIQMVLLFLAVLVVFVAGIGTMVSIYNSMSERKQEIAIMRALGARRFTMMSIILLESILLSLGGGALGLLLGHVLIGGMSPWITEYTGIIVRSWSFQWTEVMLVPGLIILASLVGFLPAAVAYKQDVATSLAP
ncbi:MAG: ABC transporter permease [Planctomycetaceae bacterium]|jgi:putative ABC transport system permease protein|nr:ABC transporter permease [Planctomycetaceae bacterium]